jgi:hypothetical protein
MASQTTETVGIEEHSPTSRQRQDPRREFVLTAVAWIPSTTMEFDEWRRQGPHLGLAGRSSAWWLGDWVRYGLRAYRHSYAVAARLSGYDEKSLMNMAYVASRFEISRRRESLSWSHHADLAALPPPDQDRWLDRAVGERLTVHALRRAIKSADAHEGTSVADASAANGRHPGPISTRSSVVEMVSGQFRLTCPVCGHESLVKLRSEA